jgi:catechol 2,3-dioxygenase-like lactoylglutathione lyase family enzyme
MKTRRTLILRATAAAAAMTLGASAQTVPPPAALEAPVFHHLHLNATDPEAAIAFYTRQFPSTSKTMFAGAPALASPNNVLVLFNRVSAPPPTAPQSAFWHFGWHVTDVRKSLETYQQRGSEVKLLPLYTTDEGGFVYVSSDTWPGTGGVLGLTKTQIDEAKKANVQPRGGAGFAYMAGPDGAIVEYQGNMPVERFNHVHMYHEEPACADLWYRTHLNAPAGGRGRGGPPVTEATCARERGGRTWPALEPEGMVRVPSGSTSFGDVSLFSYSNPSPRPLAGTQGQLMDHIALRVAGLDAWVDKLRREGVRILKAPYTLGDDRAVMIEGPSREAIELVESGSGR